MALNRLVLVAFAVGVFLACDDESNQVNRTPNVQKETSMENAKRRVKHVKPVRKKGIRYEEIRGAKGRGFEQNGGVIAAVDESTNEELWTLVVYKTEYDPNEEADVQDVFISKMKINWSATKLTVVNERKRTFVIDLATREVTER